MARKLYEKQAVRRRNGQLANGVALVVYTDAAGTVLADVSATVGGSAIAGSTVTTADIAGLGPASLRFYGPSDGTDILYMRTPEDASLGVQKIEADPDPRLDLLEAGVTSGLAAHEADTTAIHGITDTAQVALRNAANTFTADNYFKTGRPRVDVAGWATPQAAIDNSPLGSEVVFPPGVTTPAAQLDLLANRIYRGAGPSSTIKKAASTTGHVLSFVGGGGVTIADLGIDGNRANAAGSNRGIHIDASLDVHLRNISVWDCVGAGVAFQNTTRFSWKGGKTDACLYGLLLSSGSSLFTIDDLDIQASRTTQAFEGGLYIPAASYGDLYGVRVLQAVSHGAWIGGSSHDIKVVGGWYIDCGTDGSDHRGVTIDDTATRIRFLGTLFKDNAECGVWTNNTCTELSFEGCDAIGNNTGNAAGGHGFEVNAPGSILQGCLAAETRGNGAGEGCGYYLGSDTELIGSRARANYSHGIYVFDGNGVTISGNHVTNNSQRGAGLHHGIAVSATTSGQNVTVTGNRCWDDQGTKTQGYGVDIASVVDYYIVMQNTLRGNATGGLNDLGGSNKHVANNLLT